MLAVAYIATIRPGAGWEAGDYSLYIMHAINLASGLPYAITDYIHNPLNNIISPATYPPGYPAVLAVVYAATGLTTLAFKIESCLFLIGTVFLSYKLAQGMVGESPAIVVALFVVISPAFFEHRDGIGSDIPFTFWCLAALLAWQTARDDSRGRALLLLAAAAAFMAMITRAAGIALIAALAADALLMRSPERKSRIVAALAPLGFAVIVGRALQVDSGTYLQFFQRDSLLHQAIGAVLAYSEGIAISFGLSFGRIANVLALGVICTVTTVGLALSVRRAAAPEFFIAFYAALLLVFPVHQEPARYLLPILPLFAIYLITGVRWPIARYRRGRVAGAASSLVIGTAALAATILPYYGFHDAFRPPSQSYATAESREMFRAIEAIVPPSGVVLAWNPRVFALFTHRHFTIWPEHPTPESLASYVASIHAGYILLRRDTRNPDEAAVMRMVGDCTPVFTNDMFVLYEERRL